MNEFLANIDRPTLIKVTAIYFAVAAFLSLCGGVALLGLGGLGAVATAGVAVTGDGAAVAAAGGASIFAVIVGLISLVLAPMMGVAAYGLFNRKAWSRQLTVIIAGLSVLTNLLSIIFLGFSFGTLVQLLIAAFVAYMYSQDAAMRGQFAG